MTKAVKDLLKTLEPYRIKAEIKKQQEAQDKADYMAYTYTEQVDVYGIDNEDKEVPTLNDTITNEK